MRVTRPVASINHVVFAFIGISLSAVLFVVSIEGNTAVLEKVNYTINYYSLESNTYRDYPTEGRLRKDQLHRLHSHLVGLSELTCRFAFECTIGCQCNLTETNVTITCPDGFSIVEVEYPPSYLSSSDLPEEYEDVKVFINWPDWLTNSSLLPSFGSSLSLWYESKSFFFNKESWIVFKGLDNSSSSNSSQPITIYSWYNTGLDSITQGAFRHLSNISKCYLILSWNNFKDIQARQFKELPKLRGLILDNNKIELLHQYAFTGLESLVYLYLQRNKIADILPNQFKELTKLLDLDIAHNFIGAISQEDFYGLDNLEILYLASNNIVEIHPGGFHYLTNLSALHLDHNRISEIHPLHIQNLTNLFELHLDYNNISELPSDLFSKVNEIMLVLNISHNNISQFHPLQFRNLIKLSALHLGHNMISKIHPLQFQNLTDMAFLCLDHNKISEIHPLQFQNLANLASLHFDHNMIYEIHPLQFQNLTKLNLLHLDYNKISEIHPLLFQNLIKLETLHLEHNNIGVIHPYQFQHISGDLNIWLHYNNISQIPPHVFPEKNNPWPNLYTLYLGHNRIAKIHPSQKLSPISLYGLDLEYNRISEIDAVLFKNFTSLDWLRLNHNDISDIHPSAFQPMQKRLLFLDLSHNNLVSFTLASDVELLNLEYLNLANNKLRVLSHTLFQRTGTGLKFLDVSSNHINMISSMNAVNSSISSINLKLINLRHNNLYSLSTATFSGFDKSTVVMVENEAACCFLTTVNCSATIPKSQFLTCGRLLPNQVQRVTMWILGLFAIMSNLGVLFYRYRNKEKENKVQLLLISNLSISDTIMGVYMIIISSADLYYRQTFPSELWRVSSTCKFAGTLSVLSSEASVFFVTLISVDRFIGIKFPFSTYRIGTRTSRILSLVLWLIAISLSVLSTILSSIAPDWYDVSEVCTGLPLSRRNVFEQKPSDHTLNILDGDQNKIPVRITRDVVTSVAPGMYFGIAIFTVLNSICFVLICACYTGIFLHSIHTAKQAGRARDTKQERKMATKMGAIVITDLVCWAPIIILSILVQSGRHVVTSRVYTWIVTFVLPINSAINPFLYTLAALIFDFMNKRKSN